VDGDGDMDVVAAAALEDDIAWFENNGSQSFTERTIEGSFDGAISVYAVDMDGDGDMDVVGAAYTDDDIAWFENNGSQSFTKHTIEGSFDGPRSVYAVDMDGDGDMDVLGAADEDDDIAWFENGSISPSLPSFTERTIEGDFDGAYSVYAVDMDGDGDMDVVAAAFNEDDIAWFENNGSQSFTEHTIAGDFDGAGFVYAVDMDGDGDMDVVASAEVDDDIAWFENNGSQSFTEHTIAGDFDGAAGVYAVDMDGDGDMDVVAAAKDDDDIAWFENNGSQSFTERTIEGDFDLALSVYAVDMDGDGDMDVVAAAHIADDITWFENKVTVVSGNAGFRMLSSPVAGTIYDELLAPFWTQGMTGADVTSGTANVWTYNAATSAWAALSNLTTDSYTAGAGILIYVFTDVDNDGDDDIAGGVSVGIVNGTENSATVSISTTASTWNLLGNPFVSTIDADQLFSDNSNYTAVVYVYDDANSQYNTWNGSTGDLSNGLISPYQGFWIQSGGSGTSFSFTASSKSTSIGTFYRTMSDSSGSVAFQLSSGSYNTTAYLSFNIDALAGIDNADAYKLLPFGADDHLTSMFYVAEVALNTSNLPFNIMNPMTADMDVMLLTAANDSFYTNTGDVSMSWDIGSMPEDMTIHLVDQITLDTVDIRAVGSYTFALVEKGGFSATGSTSPALYPRIGQNRFKVLVNSITVSVDEELLPFQYALHQNYPNPFNPTTTLRYDIPENSHVTITIYDMLGRQVKTLINQTQDAGFKSVIWNATNDYGKPVSAGVYLYQIHAGEFVQTKKMVLLK